MSSGTNNRIAVAGRRLQWLVRLIMIIGVAALGWNLIARGPLGLLGVPQGIPVVHGNLDYRQAISIVALGLVMPGAYLVVFAYLHRLCGLYARGLVFSEQNTATIRQVGYALMAIDLMNLLVSSLTGPLLTLLGVTTGFITVNVQLAMLTVGLFVVLISRVMDAARELHENDQLTI